MFLKGKVIYLVSPQKWDSNKISKHHYANLLASSGSIVNFIDPLQYGFTLTVNNTIIEENLNVIQITIPLPRFFKFKFRAIYDILVRHCFKKIVKKYGEADILWNFDNGTYFKYEDIFKSSIKIFHPVDMLTSNIINDISNKYDLVFSVSYEILDTIQHKKKYFINHGLHNNIIKYCLTKKYSSTKPSCSSITYMGNISIPFIDRKAIIKIVSQFHDIEFRFIGEINEECSFQNELRIHKNVKFLGRQSGNRLYELLCESDAFLICYKKQKFYNADNTHKILEYLITGNPIISSPLSVYEKNSDIITFINFETGNFIAQIRNFLSNYSTFNTHQKRLKRIELALNNSYENQLKRIEEIIHSTVSN